jgi:steroid 5-alpha reductase family enzyme
MDLKGILLTNLATISISMFAFWALSVRMKNASIVDLFWGIGFVLIAFISLWTGRQFQPRPLILTLIVSVWGLRLSGYLAWRSIGKSEDYRYAAMRNRHGKRFPIVSLFTVFGLQGLLMWTIALPIQVGVGQGKAGIWRWR